MLLSVIIPLYNNSSTLARCLHSVLLIEEGVDVVVVDDGSDEDVRSIVDRYPSVRYFRQDHLGAATARNTGIQEARGDYLWFVDADDEVLPQASMLLSALADCRCDLFKMGTLLVGDRQGKAADVSFTEEVSQAMIFGRDKGTLDHTTYLYRRDFLLNHQLVYPERHSILEDSLFVLSCLDCNPTIYYNPSFQFYRIYTRTTTQGAWGSARRALFLPGISQFFTQFRLFSQRHEYARSLYDRYLYVYLRVLLVKCCSWSELLSFRQLAMHYWGRVDVKMRLLENEQIYRIGHRLCTLWRQPSSLEKSKSVVQLLACKAVGLAKEAFSELTVADESSLFDEMRREAVSALVGKSLTDVDVSLSRAGLFKLAATVDSIESTQRRRERALSAFASEVKAHFGYDTVVVKGSSLSRYYPDPLLRECGDNDVYFGNKAQEINQWLIEKGVEVDMRDPRHSTFTYQGVSFENHAYLMYPQTPGDTSKEPDWHFCRMGENLLTLCPEEEALFVAAHMEHHAVFHNECVILRQLIDWALLLQRVDYEKFNRVKAPSDINRFADLLTQYCISIFNIPVPQGWMPLSHKSLLGFCPVYMTEQRRAQNAVVRVTLRSLKYLRYRSVYKEVYGVSPFKRYYLHNILQATRQLLLGQHRAEGREKH